MVERLLTRSVIKAHSVLAESWILASIFRGQSRDEITFQVRNWQTTTTEDGRINLESRVLRMVTPNMAGCHTDLKFQVRSSVIDTSRKSS